MQYKIISLKDNPYTGKLSTFVANCSNQGKNYQIYKDTEGNGFVSPLPSTDELASFYTKPYFDEKFNEKKNVDRANNQAETIKKSRFFTPQGMLLDIGAGNGYFLQALQKLGLKVFGVEPAQAAVDNALSRGVSSDEIIQGDISTVPPKNYDYISVMDVLEHLLPADLELMFNRLLALMSNETTLFVKTFFNDDEFTQLIGEEAYWQDHSWEHLFVPSARGFAEILLSHGLEIKEILKQEKSGPIISIRKITGDSKEAEQRVAIVVGNHYASIKKKQMEYKLVSVSNNLPLTTQITALKTLWNFLAPETTYFHNGKVEAISKKHLSDADFIIVCGSNDLQSPQEAIDIYTKYLQKIKPNIPIIFSGLGGHSTIPSTILKPSEAEAFYEYATKQIPNANLLVEPSAMNSGQNITKSYELLKNMDLIPKRPARVILIQSTAAQLRAVLTFQKQYPEDWEYVVSIPSTQVNPHIMSSKEIYFHLMYALRELLTTVNYMNGENPFVEKTEIPLSIQKLTMELFQTITNTETHPNFIEFCNQSVQIIRDTFTELEKPFMK